MKWNFWNQADDKDEELGELQPTSLEEYYASQDRAGSMSWLIAVGTFFVTLALALGLFLSVRWAVHKIHNNSNKTNVAVQSAGKQTPKQPTSTGTTSGNASSQSSSSTSSSSTTSGAQATVNAPTNPSNPTVVPPTTETTPATTSIANTGPGNVLALFIGSSLMAGLAHYTLSGRKSR